MSKQEVEENKQEVGKDKMFEKNRELIAVFCEDTTLEFEIFQLVFENGKKVVSPQLIRKIGDFGMGQGIYHFFEPKVRIPANSVYQAEFKAAPHCANKTYDFKLFQQEIKEPVPEEKVVLDT